MKTLYKKLLKLDFVFQLNVQFKKL